MKKNVIGLIDGESGNIGSIKIAIKDIIKNRPYQLKVIKDDFNPMIFDKIILPGQGAYATLISNLKKFRIYQPLKKRLQNRATDSEQKIEERIRKAQLEMTFASQFDHILVNDDLEKAKKEAVQLVTNFIES